MPASTMPRPPGVSGTAVSSEAERATNMAPLRPRLRSVKPSAWMTKKSRSASVIQISTVRMARPGI